MGTMRLGIATELGIASVLLVLLSCGVLVSRHFAMASIEEANEAAGGRRRSERERKWPIC